jgi:xanthosine phosphorylase
VSRESASPTDAAVFHGATLGILLGSGLDAVADGFRVEAVLPFDQVEGVGAPTVAGHSGELRRCEVSGHACLFVCGRRHFYEGGVEPVRSLMRFLHRAGLRRLVITSAAGSLVKSIVPGELVVVTDIVDAQSRTPVPGEVAVPETGRPTGSRRLALDAVVSRDLWVAASRAKVGLGRGSAVASAGPLYETPAEVRALQETGASVVTMSGAPEIGMANALGIQLAMVAVVTNWATGISSVRLRHEDVLEAARAASSALRRLVTEFVAISPR